MIIWCRFSSNPTTSVWIIFKYMLMWISMMFRRSMISPMYFTPRNCKLYSNSGLLLALLPHLFPTSVPIIFLISLPDVTAPFPLTIVVNKFSPNAATLLAVSIDSSFPLLAFLNMAFAFSKPYIAAWVNVALTGIPYCVYTIEYKAISIYTSLYV